MSPKKRPRLSKKAADSGKEIHQRHHGLPVASSRVVMVSHQPSPMKVKRSLLRKPLLVVKRKSLEDLRSEQLQASLHSTATG